MTLKIGQIRNEILKIIVTFPPEGAGGLESSLTVSSGITSATPVMASQGHGENRMKFRTQ